jgi:hypothetical protein
MNLMYKNRKRKHCTKHTSQNCVQYQRTTSSYPALQHVLERELRHIRDDQPGAIWKSHPPPCRAQNVIELAQ